VITLNDEEVRVLLTTMAIDSEGYDVRQIAVMDSPSDIEFTDSETGELFDADTVARIYAVARARTYHCDSCGKDRDISDWDRDGHNVNLCTACLAEAEMENAHSDGYHTEPDLNCPLCKS
jgi:hypothetical protein